MVPKGGSDVRTDLYPRERSLACWIIGLVLRAGSRSYLLVLGQKADHIC
jgi:hypothetical protein